MYSVTRVRSSVQNNPSQARLAPKQGDSVSLPRNGSGHPGTSARQKNSKALSTYPKDTSYIHMSPSESQAGVADAGSPTPPPGNVLLPDVQYSTVSTGSLPPMQAIGIRRGAELLKSRPPQDVAIPGPTAISGGDKLYQQKEVNRSLPIFGDDESEDEIQIVPHQRAQVANELDGESDIELGLPQDILTSNSSPGGRGAADQSLATDVVKNGSQFYLLQSGKGKGGGTHILSSDNLAAHEQAVGFYCQPASTKEEAPANSSKVARQRAIKISTGTLGSPFDPSATGNANALFSASSADQKAINDRLNKSSSSKRGPPPVSGANVALSGYMEGSLANGNRTRKLSDASDKSIKKDDLLERLANALKKERKKVALYQQELKDACDELDKLLLAEQQRDAEFARLNARHLRDKQIISTLKLKIEKQALELNRAEEVPEHEAEMYLDLLRGNNILNNQEKHTMSKFPGDRYAMNPDLEHLDTSFESGEKSMQALLYQKEQSTQGKVDVLDSEWTKQAIAREKLRKKNLAKRIKEAVREAGLPDARQNSSFSTTPGSYTRAAAHEALDLLNQGQELPKHGRKISFVNSIRKLTGARKRSPSLERSDWQQNGMPASTFASAFEAQSKAALPPIPVDPKDVSKAQSRRIVELNSQKLGSGLAGTYGRSSSMDIQGPKSTSKAPGAIRGNPMAGTGVGRPGYASDTELYNIHKNLEPSIDGASQPYLPQAPVDGGRYRPGIAGGKGFDTSTGRGRKFSFSKPKVSGASGSGFFQHRK